jgi:DNA polymerase-1
MLRIDAEIRRRKLRSLMTLQVHDELLFDVVPAEAEEMQALVKHEMESRRQVLRAYRRGGRAWR